MAKNLMACFLFTVAALGYWSWLPSATAAESGGPMLAHNVYFSLNDNSMRPRKNSLPPARSTCRAILARYSSPLHACQRPRTARE